MRSGPRIRRLAFAFAAGASLSLCVTVLFLWRRSEIVLDQFTVAKDRKYFLASEHGWLRVGSSRCDAGVLVPLSANAIGIRPVAPCAYSASMTCAWENAETADEPNFGEAADEFDTYGSPNGARPRIHHVGSLAAPHWAVAAGLAVAPAAWLAPKRRRARAE